ncbi:hypothetical protein BU15DRAFT_74790 [Melanogaster broomeanus]|nr:hypothetical protein BU15DRAFT_74790 [Melanogaster broomeanus]
MPLARDPWTTAIMADEYTTSSQIDTSIPSLIEILGQTVLPLPFSTTILESSTRRIRTIIPPEVCEPSMVVEQELERRVSRVALGSWMLCGSECSPDFPKLVIEPLSNDAKPAEFTPDGADIIEGQDEYDPHNDVVTILVDQMIIAHPSVGMGHCGTWCRLSTMRVEEASGDSSWYMEGQVASFSSFYTESAVKLEVEHPVLDDVDILVPDTKIPPDIHVYEAEVYASLHTGHENWVSRDNMQRAICSKPLLSYIPASFTERFSEASKPTFVNDRSVLEQMSLTKTLSDS